MKKISCFISCVVVLTGIGISGYAQAPDIKMAVSKLNKLEIQKAMDMCLKAGAGDDKELSKQADSVAGLGKTVNQTVQKDVFFVYAGGDNKFNLKAGKPLAVVVCVGMNNSFTATKTQPFEGEIVYITHMGMDNAFTGGPRLTFEEYKRYLPVP